MNYSRASAIVVSRNPGMMAHSISSSSGGDRRGADTCCGPRALAPLVACIFVARDGLRSRFAPSPLARAGGRTHARPADDGPAQKTPTDYAVYHGVPASAVGVAVGDGMFAVKI